MKRILCLLMTFALILTVCSGCGEAVSSSAESSSSSQAEPSVSSSAYPTLSSELSLALVTDYNDISDQSTTQAIYEACQKYCDKHRYSFNYYKPMHDTDEDRMAMVDTAVSDGYQTILMAGKVCAAVLSEAAAKYPEIRFAALDISAQELNESGNIPDNVYCMVFRGELCGYMAGYYAVKSGYTQLGFLGGTDCEAVRRYGYGFVQGANQAAKELGDKDVTVRYCYSSSTYGDDNITEAMRTWISENKTELIFAAGGSVYTSAAAAARKAGAKVIGSELDQASYIRTDYGKGIAISSAVKNMSAAVAYLADRITGGTYPGGTQDLYGLISDTPADNYVALADTTTFGKKFSEEDYSALVASIRSGALPVSFNPDRLPSNYASYISLEDQGTIQ